MLLLLLTLAVGLFTTTGTVRGQIPYDIQVGAWGDNASKGNMGVGAEIRTRITPPSGDDLAAAFWVGDNLQNGAFIQFGYQLTTPGPYCLYAEMIGDHGNCLGVFDNIGYGDARWFWQYWPNSGGLDFYYGTGPANSAGVNGSWHVYKISPNASQGWNFVFDGKTVWNFNMFQATKSKDPAYMVAEEVSSAQDASGTLGPVEFRNLIYSNAYKTWQAVTSLSAISGCSGMNPNCGVMIPYGVKVLGANDIVAGSGQPTTQTGSLLWPRTFTLTVSAPSDAQITIDRLPYLGGFAAQPLLQGSHSISVPAIVQIDSTDRLRFDHWSDGSTALNRIIDLSSDMNLQAVYVQQYKLTIISSFPSTDDGWYDEGSSANFGTTTTPRFTNTLGLMIFIGWHNQDGTTVTTQGSGSILMNSPNTLEAAWLTLNYLIPIVLSALSATVIVLRFWERKDAIGRIERQRIRANRAESDQPTR